MNTVSARTAKELNGVHPILVAIVVLALRKYADEYFMAIEGTRSKERQRELVDAGKSQTMNSRHLIQEDGYAHAVDLAPIKGPIGEIPWDDWDAFKRMAQAVKKAAEELGYSDRLTWGGDWPEFRDGPHFEIEV